MSAVIIANTAAANGAAASAAAARAKEIACQALVQGYTGSTERSVMRQYAECVYTLYPDDAGILTALKWVVGISLLAAVLAGLYEGVKNRGDALDMLMLAFVVGVCVFFGFVLLGGCIALFMS